MGIFSDVRLEWGEAAFTITADRVLGAIAVVEDHITLGDLGARKSLPLAKISMAYGAVLRYAGAKVSDDEVYNAMFRDKGRRLQRAASEAVFALQVLMIPPEHLRAPAEETKPGKAEASEEPRAASSPSATSSRSAPPG